MAGRRELVFPPLPYIVVYRVTDSAVEISRIDREHRLVYQSTTTRSGYWLALPLLNRGFCQLSWMPIEQPGFKFAI